MRMPIVQQKRWPLRSSNRGGCERVCNDVAGLAALVDRSKLMGLQAGLILALEASGGYKRGLRWALIISGFRNAKNNRISASEI